MDELYRAIEIKIASSGYPEAVSGLQIYEELCDFVDEKENGAYVLLSKQSDDTTFEYHLTVMEQEFNLTLLLITTSDHSYSISFDEHS